MKKTILLIAAFALFQQFAVAQCYPDRHSTNYFDGWISCEPATSPNPARPVSHFILYDFGKVYKLGQMTIWNTNDPPHLDWGMKDVAIDYSTDGENWYTAGDFTFPQASGLSTYEGEEGPYLGDIEGRYLLITGLTNYGGECFGLSEMRVTGEEVIISDVEDVATLDCVDVKIYPNPFAEEMTLDLSSGCSGDVRIIVYDSKGQMISGEKANLVNGQQKSLQIGRDLPAGAYSLYIEYGGKSIQRSIIKMNRT
jgi:hypothetical protein